MLDVRSSNDPARVIIVDDEDLVKFLKQKLKYSKEIVIDHGQVLGAGGESLVIRYLILTHLHQFRFDQKCSES